MDDDEFDDTGIGPLAAYQLGRWSAESDQDHRELLDRLTGCEPVAKVDYDYALQINRALAAENRRLIELVNILENQLAEYRHNYDRLSQWGDEVAKELNERRARDAERGQ